ncbi:MAG: hypothetical protein Q4G40_00805 [Brachybacterium sp.]|nr:hypothetical protein [Brachybacterium sp.]
MILALVATIAVLTLPGLPAALALRLRGFALAVFLAPLSLFAITLSAEVGHRLGVPWSPLTPLAMGLILAIPVLLVHLLRGRWGIRPSPSGIPPDPPAARAALIGLVVGGAIIAFRSVRLMGNVDAVSQTFDNLFHLNAVRHIMRLQDASAWAVGNLGRPEGELKFYPALWHQTVSLVTELTPAGDIVLATNALMLVSVAVLWPLGAVALVRLCTSAGPVALLLTGLFSGISGAFPYGPMVWGILLPYLLSVVLLPALVIVLAQVTGLVPPDARFSVGRTAALAVATAATTALAHPQGVFNALVLGIPLLLWAAGHQILDRSGRDQRIFPWRLTNLGLLLGAILVAFVMWENFRPRESIALRDSNAEGWEALLVSLSLSPSNGAPSLLIAVVLVLASISVLLLTRSQWLVLMLAGALLFSYAARTVDAGPDRYAWVGAWFGDIHRLAALPVVVAVPILALGAGAVIDRVAQVLRDASRRDTRVLRSALSFAAAVMVGVFLLESHLAPSWATTRHNANSSWAGQRFLSDDERELLEELPDYVDDDALMATARWNGGGFAYALSDVEVLNPTMRGMPTEDGRIVRRQFREAAHDPVVCDAVQATEITHVLDFGPEDLWGMERNNPGVIDLDTSDAAREVHRVGDAAVYEVLPCRGTDGELQGP